MDIGRVVANFRYVVNKKQRANCFVLGSSHTHTNAYDPFLPHRFFAGAILHHEEMSTEMDGVAINYTVRQPIGVAGLISPWNLPLYLLSWKIAPCIAVGNTCVCKPSEMTSMTAWMMAGVLNDAGLPAGVVNLVMGVRRLSITKCPKCEIVIRLLDVGWSSSWKRDCNSPTHSFDLLHWWNCHGKAYYCQQRSIV
jgi:hypothetical protein